MEGWRDDKKDARMIRIKSERYGFQSGVLDLQSFLKNSLEFDIIGYLIEVANYHIEVTVEL